MDFNSKFQILKKNLKRNNLKRKKNIFRTIGTTMFLRFTKRKKFTRNSFYSTLEEVTNQNKKKRWKKIRKLKIRSIHKHIQVPNRKMFFVIFFFVELDSFFNWFHILFGTQLLKYISSEQQLIRKRVFIKSKRKTNGKRITHKKIFDWQQQQQQQLFQYYQSLKGNDYL